MNNAESTTTSGLAWFKSSYSGAEGGQCVEVAWLKSSYSGAEGGDCVEVAWSKSSYSGTEGGQCVEVAADAGAVLIRDSKAVAGPVVTVSRRAWTGFIELAASTRSGI